MSKQTARDEAAQFLKQVLTGYGGTAPVAHIRMDTAALDFAWGTVLRAKKKLGITSLKRSDIGWNWVLSSVQPSLSRDISQSTKESNA